MSDIKKEVIDTYFEHPQHDSYDENCSECFKEKEDKERVEVCETCGGTGEVDVDEQVYPGEGHMAPTGTEPCPTCCIRDNDIDMSGADGSDDR